MRFFGRSLLAASAAALFLLGANAVASAAPADVKAGVDRWMRGDYAGAVAQWLVGHDSDRIGRGMAEGFPAGDTRAHR